METEELYGWLVRKRDRENRRQKKDEKKILIQSHKHKLAFKLQVFVYQIIRLEQSLL